MRQSMAFNLEFKITYDELSPSLQDMFKSLQGQITDNRNEITDINMDITDISNEITEINNEINTINNHLTQIDNSITNINENIQNIENDIIQIEGDITDLGDQITEINNNITIINDKLEEVDPDAISNLDFLNLAPKIGYYQDDTIEVISKYNMNHQRGAVVIYHDNKGQEILYFGANDGSYTKGGTYNCFKAVRTDTNSPFIFYNEPLEIPYIKDLSSRGIIHFLGCGNYYMIVYVDPTEEPTSPTDSLNKCHLYLYNTNYSSDEFTWTGKDIYPLVYKTINEQIYGSTNSQYVNDFLGNFRITFFYNRNNNLLFMWFQKNAKPIDSNLMTLLIVNVSTESFVRKITLPNIYKYIGCSSSYSFSNTQHITEADSVSATITNTLTEGWEPWRFIWYPEQEILKVCCVDKSVNYYHWPHNGTSYTTNYSFIFTFQVPRAVWDSGSNVNIVDYNSRNYGPGMTNPHYGNSGKDNLLIGYRNSKINCRDETNNTLIVTSVMSHEEFKATISKLYTNKMDVTQQKNNPSGWLYYGQNSQLIINCLYFGSPDASLWGKGWNYAVSCSNKVLLNSASFQNSKITTSNIMVSSFSRVDTNSDGITIVRPNQYTVMNTTRGVEAPDGGDVFPVFSQYNSLRFTCTLEDYSRYYKAQCSANGLGINLWVNQYTLNSDNKEFTIRSAIKAVTFKPPRYTGSGTTNYYLNENYGGAKQEFAGVFYNPLGDYYIYFVRDTNTTVSTSSTRNKIYFIVVEPSNGNVHYFGHESFNSWNEAVRNNLNGVSNSSNYLRLLVYNSTTIDSRTMMFIMYFNNNSINNTYGVRFTFKITLSSDFNSFTGVNVPNPPGIHPDNGYNYCYGGSTIGFISANKNWYSSPIYLYTQKPLPGISGGTSYTIDQFLTDTQFNKYAIYTESNQGLVGYVPSTNIFLGGYYTVIQNPIQFTCTPNANNYIYLERGIDRDTINVQVSTSLHIQEGERMFSRICIAKITTNGETLTNVEYYRINIGYNDYVWNGGVTEVINELVASGSEGQVLKIRENSITPDNNFRVLRVVDNDTDFNEESKTVVTIKSIFDTWSRHNVFVRDVIFGGEIGLNDGGDWKNGYDTNPTAANWTFIEPNYIKNSNNQSPFSMFISNDTFTDHEITLFCHRLDYDDDMLIWIVAWAENTSVGGFDTLSIIKMDTYQNSYTVGTNTYNTGVLGDRKMVYRLVLNLGTSRQFSIVNEDKLINTTLCRDQSKGRDYKLYVKRAGRTITWKVSALGPNDPDQCPLLDSTTISYTFPNTKPSDWSNNNWNIVQKLLGSPQKVGVGTLSQPCQFTIVESSLFNDVDIYRLDKDAIYSYDSSSFKYVDSGKKISDNIPLHSWLYNKTTKKLFHFSGANNYTLIDH